MKLLASEQNLKVSFLLDTKKWEAIMLKLNNKQFVVKNLKELSFEMHTLTWKLSLDHMKRGIISYHEITYLGDYTNDKASNL